MNRAVAAPAGYRASIINSVRGSIPTRNETLLVIAAAIFSVLSFPDFNLWFLAWIGLAPLLFAVVVARTALRAFVLGWLFGTMFFYGTCWWLTYPMIRYGHIPALLAYPLLLLPIIFVAVFPAIFCGLLARVIQRFGPAALWVAPLIWVSTEWLRYAVTGQLWNAIGYSQAFHPVMIQPARWGGVYAVGFLILLANCAIAGLLLRRRFQLPIIGLIFVALLIFVSSSVIGPRKQINVGTDPANDLVILAIQPNVPMDTTGDPQEMNDLLERHLALSRKALTDVENKSTSASRLLVWPESPMNFSYSTDPKLRDVVGNFARANHISILLNSLEPAADGGDQNSAVLINQAGVNTARYDKIRLMPFGEYVPLPRWLPGASSVRGLVGEFKPGRSYTLMPLGAFRAGVFICIEAAHPGIARTFSQTGANVLINISNDGYLGPTAVMNQHLANAIFRAVENDQQLIRVTNSGISANIMANGSVLDRTGSFQQAVRTWTVSPKTTGTTFYSRHGDAFVYGCALISLGIISASFMRRRLGNNPSASQGVFE